MTQGSKDSLKVKEFMSLFSQLKEWSDDAPEDLSALAKTDASVNQLCNRLSTVANLLELHERRARRTFAAPVNPGFVDAWRDYQQRYASVLSRIWLLDLIPELATDNPSNASGASLRWEIEDDEARGHADAIEEAIGFAQFNADQEHRWDESQQQFIQSIHDGVAAWEMLKEATGFELHGVFRRRALVPFVLVPRKVAAKEGSGDMFSMLNNLQQAYDAFVCGAPYAAVALMRSIMEAMLRDHYSADGRDLRERIRNARTRLPRGASDAALDRLRRLANAILHLDHEKSEAFQKMDSIQLEKEIVSLLLVLRALIEGVK